MILETAANEWGSSDEGESVGRNFAGSAATQWVIRQIHFSHRPIAALPLKNCFTVDFLRDHLEPW
jgi:hypothetical protein